MGYVCVLTGSLCYLISEILAKRYLSDCSILEIALVRFAFGAPLIFVSHSRLTVRACYFACVNLLNSLAGLGSILYGTMQSFAIASQTRPLFIGLSAALLFQEQMSRRTTMVLFVCAGLSIAVVYTGASLFSPWTYLFIATILLQAISFAMVGQTGTSVWSFLALYNLLGFWVCLIAGELTSSIILERMWTHAPALGGSAAFGLAGSVLVLVGMKEGGKARNSVAHYVRLPLTILVGVFLFAEPVNFITLSLVAAIMGLLCLNGFDNNRR
ncbi:MAG TPA: hypothetical protein VET25_02155 [Aestuariivirgaceae bacterium]|nr:hypothetical protein [Aestuariivirgaceae bacterium]